MGLLSDPQPAIEWLCTSGSLCIGIEGKGRLDGDVVPALASDPRTKVKRPLRFPLAKGDA